MSEITLDASKYASYKPDNDNEGNVKMARMTSSKSDSERYRSVLEFNRPISGVGYSNMDGTGPSISLSFRADDETGSKPKMKERDCNITLGEADLGRIIQSLFTSPQGTALSHDNGPSRRLATRAMESAGLFFEQYRHPGAPHWVNPDGYYKCMAVNSRHAEWQFQRLLKEKFDGSKIEVAVGEGEHERWHLA